MPRPSKFRPGPFEYHEIITLSIDTLTNLGQGLGRVDNWVVMVPFALPGEKVRVRIYRNHKNYSEGDLVEVLEPSADRVTPVCPLFQSCGGCQYQMLSYAAQLEWKHRQVVELLSHMAGLEFPVDAVVGSPREYGYRSKITPHFDKPREGRIGAIGFLKSGRRFELVDVPHCPIAMDGINAALPQILSGVRADVSRFRSGATLLLREAVEGVVSDPQQQITERVGELELQFLARDFFQNNPFILPLLVEHVVAEAVKTGARLLVDAYCGSGLFALSAAERFDLVAGVEISESSVAWAEKNALRNGITNCRFLAGSAEGIFETLADTGVSGPESVVVIDPPRKGCDALFLEQLFRFGPCGVVYVSCNPATQMRDLTLFVENGFTIERVQPFDLFPQTKHLECVVTLKKSGTSS